MLLLLQLSCAVPLYQFVHANFSIRNRHNGDTTGNKLLANYYSWLGIDFKIRDGKLGPDLQKVLRLC